MRQRGNIDLSTRPVVENADGSFSTVNSFSVNLDDGDGEILLPLVGPKGETWSEDEAIAHYLETGQHLGKFENPDAATAYAEQLHREQERQYAPRRGQR